MKTLLSLLLLLTLVNAQDKLQTSKTSCLQQSAYPNKTLVEQKKILIEKAKQESLEELYGTLISSSTDIESGKMTMDKIQSRAVGAVRVSGNPSFYNGKNLGEICTDVKVYITKKDLEMYSPKKVSLTHYCFNDPSVAMKDIKQEAKFGAYREIIGQYKPSMKVNGKDAEQFIHGFIISNDKFDFETASYCFNATATILPYELELASKKKNIVSNTKVPNKNLYTSCKSIKEQVKTSKNGYYNIFINEKEYNVYCEMELDGGGWTRVWEARKNNYNKHDFNYNVPNGFIKSSTETLIAYNEDGFIESPYKFITPRRWKAKHPLSFSNSKVKINTINLNNGRKYMEETLYFGYQNFSSSCTDDFKGGSWGKVCISNTTAPFYTSFAHTEVDHCNTSKESYNSEKCQNRRFNIFMR